MASAADPDPRPGMVGSSAGGAVGRRVLRDRTAAEAFDRDGFAVVPLLGVDEVEHLLERRRAMRPATPGLDIDYMQPDRSFVADVADLVIPVVQRRLDLVAPGYTVVFATFVLKNPGADSSMHLHDDMTYVHGGELGSLSVWVPLVDVGPDLDNGALALVPRSHRLPAGQSGTGTPHLFRPYATQMMEQSVVPTVPRGHAIVYDSRLLHGSGPNLTAQPRPAVVCTAIPTGSQLVHVVATGRRERRIYAVSPGFFVGNHPHSPLLDDPPGAALVSIEFEDLELDPGTVAEVLGWVEPPERVPPVPDDLVGRAHGLPALQLRGGGAPVAAADVRVSARTLPAPAERWEGRRCVVTGAVGALAVPRSAAAWSGPVELRPLIGADAESLVVLDPGSRFELIADGVPPALVVDVRECPTVGAGLLDDTAVAELRLGGELRLHGSLFVWNQGPGPVVLGVRQDRPRRTGRSLGSFRRGVRSRWRALTNHR